VCLTIGFLHTDPRPRIHRQKQPSPPLYSPDHTTDFEITGCALESLSALGVEFKMMVGGDEDSVEFGGRSQYTHICLHT
jgi:hypothetical protein